MKIYEIINYILFDQVYQVEYTPYGFAHAVQALTFKPNERTVKNAFIKQAQLFPYNLPKKNSRHQINLSFQISRDDFFSVCNG